MGVGPSVKTRVGGERGWSHGLDASLGLLEPGLGEEERVCVSGEQPQPAPPVLSHRQFEETSDSVSVEKGCSTQTCTPNAIDQMVNSTGLMQFLLPFRPEA